MPVSQQLKASSQKQPQSFDMKIFLKSILMTLLIVAGFTTMQAQKQAKHDFDPAKKAAHKTAMMTEKLSLSESQATKVKDINLKYAQKMKAAHDANADGDKAKKHEASKGLRTEQMNELRQVLTAEQWNAWEQMKKERKGKHGRKGKGKVKPEKAY